MEELFQRMTRFVIVAIIVFAVINIIAFFILFTQVNPTASATRGSIEITGTDAGMKGDGVEVGPDVWLVGALPPTVLEPDNTYAFYLHMQRSDSCFAKGIDEASERWTVDLDFSSVGDNDIDVIRVVMDHIDPMQFSTFAGEVGTNCLDYADYMPTEDTFAFVEGEAIATTQLAQSIPAIQADAAHQAGLVGTGATVCIIDTGLDVMNADIPTILFGYNIPSKKGYDPTGVKGSTDHLLIADFSGHGTAMAGIIASQEPQGLITDEVAKSAGIAPGVQLIIMKVSSPELGVNKSNKKMVKKAISGCGGKKKFNPYQIKADVISMALRFGAETDLFTWSCQVLKKKCPDGTKGSKKNDLRTIDKALKKFAGATIPVFVPAGTTLSGVTGVVQGTSGLAILDNTIGVTAAYDMTFSIPATNQTSLSLCTDTNPAINTITCHNACGPGVDLAAPGNAIYAPTSTGGAFDLTPHNMINSYYGSSAATAHAAGAAALIKAKNPSYSAADVLNFLASTAILPPGETDPYNCYGAGNIQVMDALNMAP